MKFTSLTQRFALWFTVVSLLPILLIGNTLLHTFETEIQKTAIQQVSAIADKKVEQIETYLLERLLDANYIRGGSTTYQAMREFTQVFAQSGVDSDAYRQLDAHYRDHFKRFVEQGAGYYDLFLISPDGTIVYTQSHESDFATNLFTGPYSATGLGKVTRHALEKLEYSMSDFEYYAPSNGAIAAFIAYPIIDDGNVEGVLALQFYSERVFEVLTNNVGLGKSGETIVIRLEDEHTALVMAPLKYDTDAALKRKIPLNTPSSVAVQKGLDGQSGGALTIDYRGNEVVAAWRHLPLMNWGMVVEMDVDEAFAPVYRIRITGLIILVLTLIAAVLGAVLFNRRVVVPLKNLNRSAQYIAAGNLHQRAPVEGWNEMGELAHTFNDMTVRLNASNQERENAEKNLIQLNQELEHRVAARTADLERANASLAIKEEETRSVVEHMVDCVVTTDDRGFILSANPVMEKLFGYTPDEAIGQDVAIIVPEPDRSRHQGYMEHYCRTGKGQEYVGGAHGIGRGREVEGVHKNGELIPVYLAVSEYFVGDERHFTGVMRDIREHVRIMKDLEQASKEAEQANEAKSAFLAAMSHEIRTPMNGVVGMIDMLRQTSLSGYQMEMANLIRDSAYDLLDIIEDILDFSKIEAGKLEIEQTPMSLTSVVEKACGVLEQLAVRKSVELTLFTDPAIPTQVLGDALRLRQVLINIVNNAIKFSSGQDRLGQVSLRASLVESDSGQVMISFQVIDNGIGMDKEAQQRLFTSFTQADTSTTRRFGGTGLGLAISRQLVKLMGGEITVQSAPKQGSTFTIQLPFKPLPSTEKDAKIFDFTGLSCLVFGKGKGLSDDFVVYLKNAGANVVQISDMDIVRKQIESFSSGLWIIVIDAEHEVPPVEELRAAFAASATANQHDFELHFVIIKRGRRRRERIEDSEIVTLDGDIMYRESFLHAVAVASGRIRMEEEAPVSGRFERAPVPPSREEALQQGQLILVAEDNEINQKVIRQQLALLGYAADIAIDGREAFQRWESGDYALLLSDLHMPNMDGYQLTKAIRSSKTGQKNIPIVALTANALKGEMEHCRSIGMDDYLSKPVQLEDLQTMLEKYLKIHKPVPAKSVSGTLTVAPSTTVPVDIQILKELIGDDSEMIRELLQEYRANAVTTTKDLHAAFQAGQWEIVGSTAHKLKSSSRSIGAMVFGELCAKIEQAGKSNDVKTLEALLPAFDEEMARVEAYLESLHQQEKIKEEKDENS
jgi:two-component system, sensor histidine kinase and response regulator